MIKQINALRMIWYLSNKQCIHCTYGEYACSDYWYLWEMCEVHSILQYVAVMEVIVISLFLLLTCWRCPLSNNLFNCRPITYVEVNKDISKISNQYFTFLVLTFSSFDSTCTILLHQYLVIRIWLNNDTVASVTVLSVTWQKMLRSWPHPALNAMTPASVTVRQP